MKYLQELTHVLYETEITNNVQQSIEFEQGIELVINKIKNINKNKIMVIGNGGSAAIASHVMNDLCKTDQVKAQCFSDYAYTTCMANDYGYENVYVNAVDMFADEGDLLIAISSSGNSENIIRAISKAHEKKCFTITLSGFNKNNKLKQLGDVNIYVPKQHYGYVELSHQIILHMITDMVAGV